MPDLTGRAPRIRAEERAAVRVLVVTNMYPTETMPAFGVFVHEQVASLRKRGIDVDVLLVNGKESRWNYARGPLQIARKLREARYDLIHAHYVFSGIMARAQLRCPVVVSFHGAGEMYSWVGWLCKMLAPFVDAFTVTSKEHAGQLGRRDAHVIPCGIDIEMFRPMSREDARRQLGLPQDRPLALFAADLRPEKRIDVARAAIALLQRQGSPVELVVVTGRPHSDIPLFMNACDALVLTSDSEGSPQVVKEAMACNLPIVSVDVGDVAEVIEGTQGCAICSRTPEDVAARLGEVLVWGGRTDGRDRVAHLSLNRTAERIIDLYRQVISRRERSEAGGAG